MHATSETERMRFIWHEEEYWFFSTFFLKKKKNQILFNFFKFYLTKSKLEICAINNIPPRQKYQIFHYFINSSQNAYNPIQHNRKPSKPFPPPLQFCQKIIMGFLLRSHFENKQQTHKILHGNNQNLLAKQESIKVLKEVILIVFSSFPQTELNAPFCQECKEQKHQSLGSFSGSPFKFGYWVLVIAV